MSKATDSNIFIGAVSKCGTRFIFDLKTWVTEPELKSLRFVCESGSLRGVKRQMTILLRKC